MMDTEKYIEDPNNAYSFQYEYKFSNTYRCITANYIKPENLDKLDLENRNINDLAINGDYLEELIIPNGVTCAIVADLSLRKLYVPDSMEFLYCQNNCLKELELPENIYNVDASNNYIEKVTFRNSAKQLKYLNLKNNRIADFDFTIPESLNYLNIENNPHIHVSPKISLFINMNPIYE